MITRILIFAVSLLAFSSLAEEEFVTAVEVSLDPRTEKERIVVNSSFTPVDTVEYDRIVYKCTLRQVIRIPKKGGGFKNKIYEPIKFKYVRRDVRMIEELEKHIHFPVPVGLEELRDKYGRLTFKFDQPVTVSHVEITAFRHGQKVWQIERDVEEPKEKKKAKRASMMR